MSAVTPSFKHRLLGPALAAGIALAALPGLVEAQQSVLSDPTAVDSVSAPPAVTGAAHHARPVRAGHRHHAMADHPGSHGMFPGHGAFGFLRGLDLSETQRDRVFEILHGQAPALRDSAKAIGRMRQELGALAMSGQYDEAKARSLSEALAGATAAMALERARGAHAVWQVLSEAQRQQVQARRVGRS